MGMSWETSELSRLLVAATNGGGDGSGNGSDGRGHSRGGNGRDAVRASLARNSGGDGGLHGLGVSPALGP